jgi:RNA polymerase sigma-70 factor, ECF subfamily
MTHLGHKKPQMEIMSFLDFREEEETDYKNLSDEALLNVSVSDPEAFAILIDRYQEAFIRKSRSILRSQEDSEDVVQETFTKIYLNASKFQKQEGASFKSWGYKILVNTSFTRYQKLKKKRENIVELTEVMSKVVEDPYSANTLEKKEMTDYIARVMTDLPKALSYILHLHFIERRPQKEIAQMENLSVGAVKTRIYRAKKEFRKLTDYNLV